jgi:hypothetical protein
MTMTTNKSTSRIRSRRNVRPESASTLSNRAVPTFEPEWRNLEDAIENERTRLMTAEAVLHCAVIAMDDECEYAAGRPHYPTLVALARDLIKQSIDQLDSLRLRQMLEGTETRADYTVKEPTTEYLH